MLKLLIVGGVAGGASAAARARRLSEDAHIVLLSGGRMYRLPTAVCRTTSAARSTSGRNCSSPHLSGCVPASSSTREPDRRSRPSTALPRRFVSVTSLQDGNTKKRTTR